MKRILHYVIIPTLLALAYAILLSAGRVPSANWQVGVIAFHSLMLAFLTAYLGQSSFRFCLPRRLDSGETTSSRPSLSPQILIDGIQQIPCAIFLVSATTNRLLFANHAAFELFELAWLPQSQLDQRRFDELFRLVNTDSRPSDDTENPISHAAGARERVSARKLIINRTNGEAKQVSVTAVPLFDANNECHSVMAFVQDLTDHNLQLKRIEEIAHLDPLTGLPNRLSILRRIQEVFDRADSTNFALLFMDFDRFKLINDSLGHEVGDQLLIEIGERIRQSIRSTDCVCVPARLGGDEFVVLLDQLADSGMASQIAERLLQALGEPYHLAGHSIVSTVSMGIVTSSQRAESATDMLRNADLAMYKSKTSGKARCSVFDDSLKREVGQRLQLENELRAATKYDEFDFDVQPIVEITTSKVVGGEALLRWQHPRLGRISANQFIGVATETGLIVPVGDHLVRKACRWASSLGSGDPAWRLHVNVSRLQLLLPTLLDLLDAAIEESALEPSRLVLEIAESSVKDEPEKVIERLHELKLRDIRVCLDNFGSGASPLAFLRELPLDFLKLDRSLVNEIETSPESYVLVEALVAIANSYRIEVIAEGIESETQRLWLSEFGCRYGQGHLFHRPVEASEYERERSVASPTT
ncbi:MAG: EAL domain-containing protein [Planctomycetales bacterium]|nr:EAL domain-containing protein [Planctomycetales bacterium]